MNCAVHNEVPATVYCRTCGKALCEACKRDVRGVIYCEDCIAARVQGAMPAVAPGTPAGAPVIVSGGPSPGLAGVLAGFFPFGVAPVYLGQYAKGLAHMVIFAGLIWALSTSGDSESLGPLFGIMLGFFYLYQIIDAVRSARAIQLGLPAPDPFGLGKTFGGEERVNISQVPIGAVVLIGLGVLFLLHNMGFFRFWWVGRMWPVILIVIGVWIFMRRTGRA
jgi:cell wall-active antibiotic response 4TMS protein YvqF/B-box zinc finger protein